MQYTESRAFLGQPFKALYLIYFVTVLLLVKIPYWVLSSLLPSWRPHPSWPLFRVVRLRTLDAAMEAMTKTSMYHLFRTDPLHLPKTVDAEGLVWVEPTPDLVVGDIKEYAQRNQVAPARVAGYWFGSRLPSTKDEKIIYELHGEFSRRKRDMMQP